MLYARALNALQKLYTILESEMVVLTMIAVAFEGLWSILGYTSVLYSKAVALLARFRFVLIRESTYCTRGGVACV